MTTTASGYSPSPKKPVQKAPTVANAIRKFSSNTWPWAMFRAAFHSTSQPMVK